MYINDVIRLVRNYYPSEYDLYEMYIWCNEVSSMLLIEDRNVYRSVTLPVASDGTFLLPDGVDIENVEYVTAGNTVLEKQDLREYGGRKLYVKGCNGIELPNNIQRPSSVTVEYLQPYVPIRLAKYKGDVYASKSEGYMYISKCEFIPGDTLVIQLNADSESAEVFENVPLLSVDYGLYTISPDDAGGAGIIFRSDMYRCTVPEDTFTGTNGGKYENSVITRVITEKTVCDAPFDNMYVDYLLAKINLYQHDTDAYNQYMTMFNSRLAAYRNWLIKRMPSDDCKLKNWW